MIEQAFIEQATSLTGNQAIATDLWQETEFTYTGSNRYYRNLEYLNHLYRELQPLQSRVQDWTTLFFALCYHDVIYDAEQNVVANDNEEKSAAYAERQLQQAGYIPEKIEACKEQILATQKHGEVKDMDTNLLTDADLCIPGQPWHVY